MYGINVSTRNVVEKHRWSKQVLHVWAIDFRVARVLYDVWRRLRATRPELCTDTLVMVTVAFGCDWLFANEAPLPLCSLS